MIQHSAIYEGAVMHRRFRPRLHHLRYRMFSFFLDLDEIAALSQRLRLFSYNKFNVFAFLDGDHGDGSGGSLRDQIERLLRGAGLDPEGGAIRVLCMPRVLGHVFNPISIFYCHGRDGALQAMLYEVNNTFGQRHLYLIPVAPDSATETIRQECDKRFYVSPFMDMAMTYDFRLRVPAQTLSVVIHGRDADGLMIAASQVGQRRALTDRSLLRAFISFPLLTLTVVFGIHWEALKLWLKGIKLRPRPAAPTIAVTTVLSDHV